MVNFGWSAASILGIFLIVAGAGLYFLRSIRPEVSRDYDIFFSAVGLACGIILVFNGWRLDPILQFSQLLLAASTAFFAFETIRLRGLATEQAKRTTPIVDDERRPSKKYEAYRVDRDEIDSEWEEKARRPRLVGRPERLSGYEEESRYSRGRGREDREPPSRGRRPSRPSSSPDRRDRPSSRPPKNDPYTSTGRYDERFDEDEWDDDWEEPENGRDRPSDYDDRPSRDRPSRRPNRDRDEDSPRSRPSSSRPSSRSSSPPRKNSPRSYEDEEPATYVDYVDYSEADDKKDEDFDDFDRSDEERDDFEDFDRPEEGDRYDDRNDRYDDDEDDNWDDDRKKGDRFDY